MFLALSVPDWFGHPETSRPGNWQTHTVLDITHLPCHVLQHALVPAYSDVLVMQSVAHLTLPQPLTFSAHRW